MNNLHLLLKNINSWSDFKNLLDKKNKQEKGQAFEELTKYFLQYNPVYKTTLKQVWLQKDVPSSVVKKLNLPSNDQGIDLIAETFEGTYWAIQCKYLQDEDQRLSHRAISTFVSLSTGIAENITYCLVCTTVDDYAKIYQGKNNIGFCTSDEWRKLDKTFFDWLRNKLSGKEKKLIPYKPKPHQTKALKEAKHYFLKENNSRGKLVFPCGAGKSLTGYWITRELKSKSTIVAVPSLSLVKQTLEVYLRESVANNETIAWLCVCSDEGIGKNDDIAIHTNEIGVPCVTDKNFIANWLKANSKNKTIIFTTYQSGKTIAEACKIAKHSFNLGIMDEAHKTVGDKDKLFSHLLFEQNLAVEKRIFMTATERRYAGSSDTVLSMNDSAIYGETFAQMSFKEAIEIGILSDYKIITLFISNDEVKKLIQQNAFVKPEGKEWDKETEARTLASLIALRKAMTDYPIHHAVTFHSSIKKAEAFEKSQSVFSKAYPKFAKVKSYHVSGAMPTSVRGKIVDEFADTEKGIITNAKCLTEGIDVPNIDCVLFADPRKSTVDIVQAVGRALRKKEGKDFGYVILPVFTETNNTDEIIESDEFKEILSTIRALASNDERIIEYFRDISKGKSGNKKDSLIQFDIDVNIASKINAHDLIESIQLKTWNKLAKLSWMPFEEAREFVRGLGLKNRDDWRRYTLSESKPKDIPVNPDTIYKHYWINLGDWLGSGTLSNKFKIFLNFEDAREYARKLNFKSRDEWETFSKSEKKPNNIPSIPSSTYKNKGWTNWGDYLGSNNIANRSKKFLPYEEAKKTIQNLGLKSEKEFKEFIKLNRGDLKIPAALARVYKNEGWIGMGDFLGTGRIADRLMHYRTLNESKLFVKTLQLKSKQEWKNYCKNENKPKDIPANPDQTYKDKGWISFGDFLGTNYVAPKLREYRIYEEAKEFVHELKIKSIKEWDLYCKSENKPKDIPKYPNKTYEKKGWINWGDWLGTGNQSPHNQEYLSFELARNFVHNIGLKNWKEWQIYCRTEKKPKNIPNIPFSVYKNKGWISIGDWLGTDSIANYYKNYLSYEDAKKFVHRLKIKSMNEWKKYAKSDKKPINIPSNVYGTYKNKGWVNSGDWLGTYTVASNNIKFREFQSAKKFVHKLKLQNWSEWKKFCKTNKKPNDIPVNPSSTYKNDGYVSVGDWLGTNSISMSKMEFENFLEARDFVRNLKIKSSSQWREYCKSGNKPNKIPSNPHRYYIDKGWVSMPDWLGSDNVKSGSIDYMSLAEAKAFVKKLHIKNQREWEVYVQSNRRPLNLPKTPHYIYKDKGWKGWSDFLGKT